MEGRLTGFTLNRDGTQNITVTITGDFAEEWDALKDDAVTIDIKKARRHRSLAANAYCWVLLDKLAAKTGEPKEMVYRQYIQNIGGNSEIVCVKNEAVDRLCYGWRRNGIGWQTETMDSKLDGCTNVILYYGSSVYDSSQMGRLLDLIIQDCKAVGIPTETPSEIARLKAMWGE
jgi:hypothetical protein